MNLIESLQNAWQLIQKEPWIFLSFAGTMATGGFLTGRWFNAEKVSNLESRIARRDEQIKDLEQRNKDLKEKFETQMPTASAIDEVKRPQRHYLIGRFTAEYQNENRGKLTPRMEAGLDLPPAEWINARLEKLDETWRVRNVRGMHFDIYEPTER
ncbi:hypothetical protein [Rhizobium sp. NLR22b]|uniref:hypothetical protein n=1 Tax=Rhizobium sp. NLR22b TaxID=2731115 RepID=UPI001C8383CA|nr:hypothetical protein [Rhizobium sp. NLR22b]MBX5240955.1 hypothetical protein [Rhizobium sp. NLR22b]